MLNDYNNYAASSCSGIRGPQAAQGALGPMAIQVVPVYSPPGYDTLTHGPCAASHLDISQAYPSQCDRFVQRLCDGNIQGHSAPHANHGQIAPSRMAQTMFESYQKRCG